MKHGHVQGTKRERPDSQSWYAVIEAETLRQLDAAAATSPEPTEDVDSAENDYEEDGNGLLCVVCNRISLEECCCCGTPLCPICFSSGGGFCGQEGCMTEERLAAMDEQLRGDHP